MGGHTRDNSRICGSARAGGCRNCRTRRDTVLPPGLVWNFDRCRRYTYLPPGLVWNLATLPPRYLPPGLVWNWATLPPRYLPPGLVWTLPASAMDIAPINAKHARGSDGRRTPHQVFPHCMASSLGFSDCWPLAVESPNSGDASGL